MIMAHLAGIIKSFSNFKTKKRTMAAGILMMTAMLAAIIFFPAPTADMGLIKIAPPEIPAIEKDIMAVEYAQIDKAPIPAPKEIPAEINNTITIPKIGVFAPIVTAQTANAAKLHTLLDSGAVFYPGSADFGAKGQTILLGHSAPANWPKIKHDTLFSRLNELKSGESIEVTYGGRTYEYTVLATKIFPKGTDAGFAPYAGNSLVLVTCWPPGRDRQRIAVMALPSATK
jgi:LPXTG-site transpeptidase (sortase) family protein